jgi:hypothetical protein
MWAILILRNTLRKPCTELPFQRVNLVQNYPSSVALFGIYLLKESVVTNSYIYILLSAPI